MSMKGLVRVKGSWGMGGGLLGVASFSLSWDSVSMPVAIFLAARGFLRAAVRLYLRCLGGAASAVRVPELISRRDLVSAVGMRGRDVCDCSSKPSFAAGKLQQSITA